MHDTTNIHAVIPARWESSRFPGKPLADILGKPMFWHVWDRARRCPALAGVVLATDDERILDAARALDVPAVMTRADHASGTDRVLEAAEALDLDDDAVVANIQGDEPTLDPDLVSRLVAPFADASVQVATLAAPLDDARAASPDRVKVVLAQNGDALYFSRAPIPHAADGPSEGRSGGRLLHVGLYAFRMAALRRFAAWGQGELEKREKLEQLRFLEHGVPIRVSVVEHGCHGVDRPEDLQAVIPLLEREQCKRS